MKKYLISGIAPSHTGVGYVMGRLERLAKEHGYEVIYPEHIRRSIRKSKYSVLFAMSELIKRQSSSKKFISKISRIENAHLILIHPQTIGYAHFINLLKVNAVVKTYVMDNSFFCIKSYNSLRGAECLKCLNDVGAVDGSCTPAPVAYDKTKNTNYLRAYQSYASKMTFYTQNRKQTELVIRHFGEKIKVSQVGLKTAEDFDKEFVRGAENQYDVVYHGANVEAKGCSYFLDLAKSMRDKTFFMPYDRKEILNTKVPNNVICKSMTWNTGLKDVVINARLVLCPSIWSAPIEGALLKSIWYNGNVGVMSTEYGFGNDIPDGRVLKLSNDIHYATKQIYDYFSSSLDMSLQSKCWLMHYFDHDCKIEKMFSDAGPISDLSTSRGTA